jgi:hypothetical protein
MEVLQATAKRGRQLKQYLMEVTLDNDARMSSPITIGVDVGELGPMHRS